MNCSCCGKKKRFFETFSEVDNGTYHFSVCKYCGDILYAIKGANKENAEGAVSELKTLIERRMKKGGNSEFQNWYDEEYSPNC